MRRVLPRFAAADSLHPTPLNAPIRQIGPTCQTRQTRQSRQTGLIPLISPISPVLSSDNINSTKHQ